MESLKIAQYMRTHPIALFPEMTVSQAVEKLVSSHVPGAPVINSKRKLIGFVSEQDCLQKMLESSYYNEQAALIKDIMRAEVVSVKPYDSVFDLAQQMQKNRPKVYPVVDDDGVLVGLITRANVLKAIDIHLRDAYA